MLAQTGRVQRGHSQVGNTQTETVLSGRALLKKTKGDKRDHVAMCRGTTHPEIVGYVGDPKDGTLGRETSEDRKSAL
jgi:hypothetical protein